MVYHFAVQLVIGGSQIAVQLLIGGTSWSKPMMINRIPLTVSQDTDWLTMYD